MNMSIRQIAMGCKPDPYNFTIVWPRRIGVVYIEGPPKATESRTAEELANEGLVGVYVDMPEVEYRKLPLARTPADMKTNFL